MSRLLSVCGGRNDKRDRRQGQHGKSLPGAAYEFHTKFRQIALTFYVFGLKLVFSLADR